MSWKTPKTNWTPADGVSDADLIRIEENTRVLESNLNSLPTTTGTAPNYLVTIPDFIGLTAGRKFTVNFHAVNGGAASTLNVSGTGAKSIIKAGGANPNIKAGVYTLVYNSTNFQLLGEGGEYGTAVAAQVLSPYTIGTETGLVTGTMKPHTSSINRLTQSGGVDGSSTVGRVYIRPEEGYYDGVDGWTYYDDPNFIASNIRKGYWLFGLVGSLVSEASFIGYINSNLNVSLDRMVAHDVAIVTIPGGFKHLYFDTLAQLGGATNWLNLTRDSLGFYLFNRGTTDTDRLYIVMRDSQGREVTLYSLIGYGTHEVNANSQGGLFIDVRDGNAYITFQVFADYINVSTEYKHDLLVSTANFDFDNDITIRYKKGAPGMSGDNAIVRLLGTWHYWR